MDNPKVHPAMDENGYDEVRGTEVQTERTEKDEKVSGGLSGD